MQPCVFFVISTCIIKQSFLLVIDMSHKLDIEWQHVTQHIPLPDWHNWSHNLRKQIIWEKTNSESKDT